jgi:predicted ATPase/DNA-binding XRE family transcriptional regulator
MDGGAFGELLRRHRRAAQLTQEDLAERSGLSVEAVSALERGWRRLPRRQTVALLAGALDLAAGDRETFAAAARRPPPPSPVANGHDALPAPPTPLIGRDGELATAVSALRTGPRLLSLTGPGGSGKTRLALAVAWELARDLEGPVAFADLAAVDEADLVAAAIRQALHLHDAPQRSAAERVIEHVAGRQALLLLDNFEHLLPAASLVVTLLERCPELRLLVTSRVPLRVRGEQVLSVPPLRVPERDRPLPAAEAGRVPAVALFVRQAGWAGAGFALSDENVEPVMEICRRLDGLPLALELAAPWLRVLTPEALLARLDDQDATLRGGPELPDRQRTLQRTLEWSHALLGPAERTLFRRLAVFSGAFELADVEAVCGEALTSAVLLDSVAALADASLVVRVDATGAGSRFRLLETVRRHAADRLAASGECEAVRRRHAEHFRSLVDRAQPSEWRPPEIEWLRRLEGAHAELRAALQWCERHDRAGWQQLVTALGWFWLTHGHLDEGRAWLSRVLEAGSLREADRRRATYLLAKVAYWQGEYELALDQAGRSLVLAREQGDPTGAGWAINLTGYIRGYAGEHLAARAALEEVLATAVDEDLRLDSLIGLGDLLVQSGLVAEGRAALERASAASGGAGARWQVGRIRLLIGIASYLEGDLARAGRMVVESLPLLAQVANWYALSGALDLGAGLLVARGDAEDALRLAAAADALRDAIGAPLSTSWRRIIDEIVIGPSRAAVPDRAEAAWADGSGLSVADATALALECLSPGRGPLAQ